MRILGIDPGLLNTGYAVIEGDGAPDSVRLVEAGVVRTEQDAPMASRLAEIARQISEIISQLNPEAVAIEELYSHYQHPRTAIIMGHARGIVLLKAAEAGLAIYPYASTRIKKSLTGNGRATKAQMQAMIRSTFALSAVPEPPDVADALAVALCHCRSLTQTEALSS
ncbi:MAG: crossover junction endodeoxyribonuclease RuvC [Candidatus Zixiibacteriota bacterium]|nr:MAG: crossover junction endodeoxyribonuclease RuvC [candidate division Zixibacteria bacterium]